MSAPAMKLVDRLRAISSGFSRSGNQPYADVLDAAIARIEAADALFEATTHRTDFQSEHRTYNNLAREQDGGDDA